MTNEEADKLYGNASSLFAAGAYQDALAILMQLRQVFPDNPRLVRAQALCGERLRSACPVTPLTIDDILGSSAISAVPDPPANGLPRMRWLVPSAIVACVAALMGGHVALLENGASSVSYPQTDSAALTLAPAQGPTSTALPKVGEVRTFAGIEMVWMPPGTFVMGLPAEEARGWPRGEYTQRQVTLTRGFWMGKYEVTNAQFGAFVNETGYRTDAERIGWAYGYGNNGRSGKQAGMCWRNPGWFIEDCQPAVCITWNDAHAYLDWLNSKGQGTFRLPTSARWEYACRAGTTTRYPWGDRMDRGEGCLNGADQAWKTQFPYADLAPGLPWNDGYALVASVGMFEPNAWGLYDMIGNVAEWCEDSWGEFTGNPLIDPTGGDVPLSADPAWNVMHMTRVIRRGTFVNHPYGSALYNDAMPDFRWFDIGFRVCREE